LGHKRIAFSEPSNYVLNLENCGFEGEVDQNGNRLKGIQIIENNIIHLIIEGNFLDDKLDGPVRKLTVFKEN
jgi:hypothetical protein